METNFVLEVFHKLSTGQLKGTILWDEIYIKAVLAYHGGSVIGKVIDYPNDSAKTVLAIIVKYLFGGPEFFVEFMR